MANIVKQVENAILYDDGTIMVQNVRGSYVHVDSPYRSPNAKPDDVLKYSMVGLMPKATHGAAKDLIKGEITRIIKENKLADLPATAKFLRNGDDAGKDEYKGMFSISARETQRPHLRDCRGQKIEPEKAKEAMPSGYWFNMLIEPWFQNNGYGKKVNSSLRAVQVVREDEVFGDTGISDEDVDARFGAIDDDDGGFDDDLGDL